MQLLGELVRSRFRRYVADAHAIERARWRIEEMTFTRGIFCGKLGAETSSIVLHAENAPTCTPKNPTVGFGPEITSMRTCAASQARSSDGPGCRLGKIDDAIPDGATAVVDANLGLAPTLNW